MWVGQSAAALGAGLTGFALAVWAYQRTGSATQLAIIAACSVLPGLVLSPVAGPLVDRWSLRTALLVSHAGAAVGAVVVTALLALDQLHVWHLYIVAAGSSAVGALHWPAFSAATVRLVQPAQLGRASGLVQLGDSTAQLLSPALGGALLGLVGLQGVILIELLTLLVALSSIASSSFPDRTSGIAGHPPGSAGNGALAGLAYVVQRRGLLGLFGLSCVLNGALSFLEVLSAPIVLAIASSSVLGVVRSVAGAGMLAGSIVMSVWGGPRNRIAGLVWSQALLGVFLVAMGLSATPPLMALSGFCGLFFIPLANGCGQILWQTKVPPHLHGRVFALRRCAGLFRPLGFLVAGVLAERVLEPRVQSGELAWLAGAAPGRGSALLLVIAGVATALATALAMRFRSLREIERVLPDVGVAAPLPAGGEL
ncbi:MFS transporter [Sorangium sp. KYC3313]|uniref:MFS transporter n=1 Tax=Sorangium sp. KYC3313 TaxID=3449740 RepID=UPI003F8C676C